jgi:hypothetical protein
LANFSFETVELLRKTVEEWNRDHDNLVQCQALIQDSCPVVRLPAGTGSVEFYPIEVSFNALTDPEERKFFDEIGTNYALTSAQVDRLIGVGPRLLDTSPVFRALAEALRWGISDLWQRTLVSIHGCGRRHVTELLAEGYCPENDHDDA